MLPEIVPFNFGKDEMNLDDSVTAVCSIVKGDLPMHIFWQFFELDEAMSYNLTTNDGVVVTKPSQKISILAIDAVKARHRGNYTCFAQNKGGSSQFSAYLAINGSLPRHTFFLSPTISDFCDLSSFSFTLKFCQ